MISEKSHPYYVLVVVLVIGMPGLCCRSYLGDFTYLTKFCKAPWEFVYRRTVVDQVGDVVGHVNTFLLPSLYTQLNMY